jgi:hypothetical protein
MANFLKYNKLATSVAKLFANTSIDDVKPFYGLTTDEFSSLITPRINGGPRKMHYSCNQ